ncbi:S1 family peptidase [Sphingomonas nostoxanthinifaciens]|nr:S1 family peptidase [Sphingomonas nostoxanthinifaciens]
METAAEALEADAAEYARTFGVAPDEALRRLEAQQASVALTDRLADAYRDRLAGIVIEHRPDYRILIVVTGAPADDVQIATAPFGTPVLLRTGALATRAAVLDAIERHQADIRAAMPNPPGMGLDPRTGALIVLTRPGDLDGDGDEAVTAARLQAIAGVPVEVKTWGDVDADLSVEGGGRVVGHDAEEARRFVCTAGFVVTDGTQTALATAAHCPDTLSFVDRDGTQTPLTMLGAWGARYQDVQIHSAGIALAPLFRADADDRARMLTSWRNRASTRSGDVVCHRGERTGYSCALVRFPEYAPPGDLCAGPCPATWVAVDGPKCKGGDSGGPVFFGTVAFGLVKGDSTEHGTCALYYYMSTDYLPPGWTLLYGTGAADVTPISGKSM